MPQSPWILERPPNGPVSLRLFCFPHAGGGPSAFARWAPLAPAGVQISVVSLPGREARAHEAPITRFRALVSALAWHLGPALLPPFGFYGHSMGALLAHALSRRLSRTGAPGPLWLGLGACQAPPAPREDPPWSTLPDEALLQALDQRYGGIPAAVRADPDLRRFLLPSMRADMAALESWAPEDGGEVPAAVRLFSGEADALAGAVDPVAWASVLGRDPGFDVVPGDHFFHRERPGALAVLDALRADLGLG